MHRSEFIKNIYHCTISIFNPIYKNDVTLGERMISIHSHNTKRQRKKREKNKHALAFILVVSVSLFVRIVSFLSVCDRLLIRCMHVNVCRQALAFVLLLHRYETIRITLKLQIWITYLDRTCKRKKRRILRKTMGEFLKISIVIVSVFEENATNSCFSPSLSEYFKISK